MKKTLTFILVFLSLLSIPVFTKAQSDEPAEPIEIKLRINEIAAYKSSGYEWIEVINIGENDIYLPDISFYENEIFHGLEIISNNEWLKPNELAVITQNSDNFVEEYPDYSGALIDSSWISLKESGEEIGLSDADENMIEIFEYLESPETSLERVDPYIDEYIENWSSHPDSDSGGIINYWFEDTEETINEEGQEEEGEEIEILYPKISEILPNPRSGEEEWIEIYNPYEVEIDLSSATIKDESGSQFTLEGILEAEEFKVIRSPKTSLNNSGDIIYLLDANLSILHEINYLDDLETPKKGQSLALFEDEFTIHHHPTPGEENIQSNQKPTAVITIQSGETEGEDKVTLNLTGENSEDADEDELTYLWDFGDGETTNSTNPPSHTWNNPGEYSITLQVTDNFGETDEVVLEIEVLKPTEEDTTESTNLDDTEPELPLQAPTQDPSESITMNPPLLLIKSFLPNPEGEDKGNEWIDVYNPNLFEISLDGYTLGDNSKKVFKLEGSLAPKQKKKITSDISGIALNNSDDSIYIRYGSQIIELIEYSDVHEGGVYNVLHGQIAIIGETTNQPVEVSEPQPTAVKPKSATPKKPTTTKSTFKNGDLSEEIYFSEIMPNPEGDDKTEWIELVNLSEEDINLGNWQIKKEGIEKTYAFDDKQAIKAGSYLLLKRADSNLALNNSGGVLQLIDFEENLIDELEYDSASEGNSFAEIETKNLSPIASIQSVQLLSKNWEWTDNTTPGKPNPKREIHEAEVEAVDLVNEKITMLVDDKPKVYEISMLMSGAKETYELIKPRTKVKITTEKNPTKNTDAKLTNLEIINQPTEEPTNKSNIIPIIIQGAIILMLLLALVWIKRDHIRSLIIKKDYDKL